MSTATESTGRGTSWLARLQQGVVEIVAHTFMLLLLFIFMLPLLWMLRSSLMDGSQIFAYPTPWLPDPVVWDNYSKAWSGAPFNAFYFNSTYIAVTVVLGVLLFSSMAAYAFARLNFAGRDIVFYILVATMMIPGMVTLIPVYIIFKNIGWINTHYPLIVPPMLSSAFSIFLLRQFFLTIPKELEDAARIDGASSFKIYWKIMIPLISPALAAVGIFTFMNTWNSFLPPLIFVNSLRKQTLPVGLTLFRSGEMGNQMNLMMAAAMITVAPVLIVYFFAQKYFIQGITLTGIKG